MDVISERPQLMLIVKVYRSKNSQFKFIDFKWAYKINFEVNDYDVTF